MTKFKVGDMVEVLDFGDDPSWNKVLNPIIGRVFYVTNISSNGTLGLLGVDDVYFVSQDWVKHVQFTPDKTSIPPKMKIYIAGKITGLGEDEITYAFDKAKKLICDWGFEAVSPLDHGDESKSWVENMLILLPILCECDGIYLLDNWHDSEGARIEKKFAEKKGMFMIKEIR